MNFLEGLCSELPLNLDRGVESLQSTVSIFMQETKHLVGKPKTLDNPQGISVECQM